MKKIGVYIRVSTEEAARRHEGSLDSQRHRIVDYVNARNLIDRGWGKIIEFYVDEARSGKDTNRPKYQALIRDIEGGKINTVLVTELSRLSRSIKDFTAFWDFLRAHKCQFLSLREQFDTSTAAGEMMIFSIINFAQFERKQTAERVTANFKARANRGLFNGGHPALGFDLHSEKKGLLVINKSESEIVKKIFAIFLEEGSIVPTLKKLEELGIKTKRWICRDGSISGDRSFCKSGLWTLLRNRHYIGEREYNKRYKFTAKESVPDGKEYLVSKATWPAIVGQDIFERAQTILNNNVLKYRPKGNRGFDYLYSSIVYCPDCSQKLVGLSGKSKTGEKFYYYAHRGPKIKCAIKRIDAEKLHRFMRDRFHRLADDQKLIAKLYDDAAVNLSGLQPKNNERIEQIRTEIKTHETQAHNLVGNLQLLPAGSGGSELIMSRIQSLEGQIKTLDALIKELSDTVGFSKDNVIDAKELFELTKRWDSKFAKLTPAERREFVRAFLGRIEVLDSNQIRVRYNCDPSHAFYANQAMRISTPKNAKGGEANASSPFLITRALDHRVQSLYIVQNGRVGGIRTRDPLVPNQVRYQLRYDSTFLLTKLYHSE
jgi:site-specific DNA recombinase